MEASGVVFRPLPYLSGGRIDARSQSSLSRRLSVDSINRGDLLRLLSYRDSRVVRKSSNYGGFCDNAHLQYYSSSSNNNNNGSLTIRCDSGKKNNKEVVMVIKEKKKVMKKGLKLLKGLSMLQELFIDVGFGLDPRPSPHPHHDHALVDQVKGGKMMISEAADLLLEQLQQLKAEEKELKRKRKEDKAKLKAARMQNRIVYQESSSSSSESSDNECGQEVIDMSSLKSEAPAIAIAPPVVNELIQESMLAALPSSVVTTQQGNTTDQLQQVIQEAILTVPSTMTQVGKMTEAGGNIECNSSQNLGRECCNPTSTRFTHIGIGGDCGIHSDGGKLVTAQASAEKIQVCMGGKCKKLGAPALLVEFQRALGVEGAVVGCKCMGKCRDGPNVRVLNNSDQAQGLDDSVRTPANPLCIGVGLEDVGLIVANFLGESEKKDMGLAAPP